MQTINSGICKQNRRGWLLALLAVVLCACTSQAKKDDQWAENHELYRGPKDAEYSKLLGKDGISYETRGDTFYAAEEMDKALYAYLRALASEETNAGLYVKIGIIHRRSGFNRLARTAFSKAIQLDEYNVPALENLGLVALHEREYDAAAELFRTAIKADNRRLEKIAATRGDSSAPLYDDGSPYRAYNGLGVVLDLQERYREAVAFYRTAAAIKPGRAYIHNNTGYSFYLADHWDEAEKYYKNAITLDTEYDRAHRNLALLDVRREQYNSALTTLSGFQDTSEAYNTVGYICMLVGQFDVAEQYLLKAIDSSPSYNELAYENLQKNRAMQRSLLAEN